MTAKIIPDPFVAEFYARNPTATKPWVKAENSSHIWTARLPADLAVGAHRVLVEATTGSLQRLPVFWVDIRIAPAKICRIVDP